MRTIAIVNQKGGCGKTTTSINLSAFLALQQKRVLLVDMDPQGHASLGVSADSISPSRTVRDMFLQNPDGQALGLRDVSRTIHENLDLAPADILLSQVPEQLRNVNGREDILRRAIEELDGQYDYIIVDCPPNVGLLTFNAVRACSEAVIPMDPSFFSLHGIGKTLETFDVLARETGQQIDARVLVTLYYGRTPFVKAVLEDIRNHLQGRHYQTVIRYSVKLAEAASHGLPIAQYCRHCAGFEDYRAFTDEILQLDAAASASVVAQTADVERATETDSVAPLAASEAIWN